MVPRKELDERLGEATARLAEVNTRLQDYAASSEMEATLSERKRLAREIHDSLTYTMTNLVMMMEAALSLSEPANQELMELLSEAQEQAKGGLGEIRRAVKALQPVSVSRAHGLRAIHDLARSVREATHISVNLHIGDVPWTLGSEGDSTAYRFVQECITNAIRHGKCSEVSIYLARVGGGIKITVRDNGIGAEGLQKGFGLHGMEERLARLGGRLEVWSQPKSGFRVEGWIPIRAKEAIQ
jgi:signal transduction histidine kinase